MKRFTLATISLLIVSMAPAAWGEEVPVGMQVDSFAVDLGSSISPLNVGSGNVLRVSGTVAYQPEGVTWDAATEQNAGGRHDGGLVDAEAGGLVLRSRDPDQHQYTYTISDSPSAVCQSAGLSSPCLVLRLPALAASRHRDLDELRENLAGNLVVSVFLPPTPVVATPPPPVYVIESPSPSPEPNHPGWFWLAATGTAGGGLVLSLAILFMALRRRRQSKTPVGRARASALRLRRQLAGDQVKARMLQVVNELAEEVSSLEKVGIQLGRAVEDAQPEELERKHRDLKRTAAGLAERGGAEAGAGELEDAAAIVEGQVERCRRWEMQRWRSAARMERIATRLEALEAELKDPAQEKIEAADALLDLLQEELELARAGEQEAQRLLGSGPPDNK